MRAAVFGRKTYDMMAGYGPTPMAAENAPAVRRRMDELQKIVFSQTMEKALGRTRRCCRAIWGKK
jgi:dihydrofolate reductase